MKECNDLISIIVPIYNVEEYIDDCINTITNQTYKNIEIILVDDGSTDNCPNICDNYANKDERIKVIHKKNGGLSDARNNGLKVAQGNYIIFVDSDDFVNINFVKNLYDVCTKNDADMAICSYKKVKTIENADWKKNTENTNLEIITGTEFSIRVYQGKGENLGFVAWNKMYKKHLFTDNEIEYPINKYYEDTFTTFKLLYHSNKVVIINSELYYYRVREGSIMTSNTNLKKIFDGLESGTYPVEYYEEKENNELFNLSCNCFLKDTIDLYKQLEDKLYKKYVMDYYIKYWKIYSNKIDIKLIKKVKYKYFYYKFKILLLLKGRD